MRTWISYQRSYTELRKGKGSSRAVRFLVEELHSMVDADMKFVEKELYGTAKK